MYKRQGKDVYIQVHTAANSSDSRSYRIEVVEVEQMQQDIVINLEEALCLLYTSDAADERSSVDLGGRRIIKKNNKKKKRRRSIPENKTTK